MFGIIGRICLSVLLVCVSFSCWFGVQYLTWHAPEWMMVRNRPDDLSAMIVVPLVLLGIVALPGHLLVWLMGWPEDKS